MNRNKLKELLLDQQHTLSLENLTPRELRAKIDSYQKTPFIIIISGVRRCGKSTLLGQIQAELDCYYVNFDDDRLVEFTLADFQTMYELLIELFGEKSTFMFDEIQNILSWERFVRRLHDQKKKVYVNGSNASMLSRELGTHLTGRNVTFSLYPFSFREFLLFKKESFDLKRLTSKEKIFLKRFFNQYVEHGGFPEYLQTGKADYLKTLYENILFRDIITRYKLPNEKPLKEVVYYAASNISKEISFNSLKKLTNLTSATTIREYFEYLENSYLCFLIAKYDPSLKKQIYSPKKVYFIDTAIAKLLGFRTTEDYGRLLENIVFLQLKRKNKEVYFHKGKHECDFLIRKGSHIEEAIQVTKELTNNKDREIAGLLEAMQTHKLKEGLILTLDQEEEILQEKRKIKVIPIWKWLLD